MHAPGYAITAEKDAVLGEDLTRLAGPVPRLSRQAIDLGLNLPLLFFRGFGLFGK
jgi:hypothetical protein